MYPKNKCCGKKLPETGITCPYFTITHGTGRNSTPPRRIFPPVKESRMKSEWNTSAVLTQEEIRMLLGRTDTYAPAPGHLSPEKQEEEETPGKAPNISDQRGATEGAGMSESGRGRSLRSSGTSCP